LEYGVLLQKKNGISVVGFEILDICNILHIETPLQKVTSPISRFRDFYV